jgi:hypothetical protein
VGCALRNLLKIILMPGQWHKITQLTHLIQDIGVIADKDYDHNAFVEKFGKKDCAPDYPLQKKPKTSQKL